MTPRFASKQSFKKGEEGVCLCVCMDCLFAGCVRMKGWGVGALVYDLFKVCGGYVCLQGVTVRGAGGHSLVDDLLKVCVEGMYVFRVCVRGGGVGVV